MNGTLNVGTSFMLNEKLDFDDPEQKKVTAWIDVSQILVFGKFEF